MFLNKKTFIPNNGYNICEVFLCIEPNVIIRIEKNAIENYPEIDTCKINTNSHFNIQSFKTNIEKIDNNTKAYNTGFIGGNMPNIGEFKWGENGINIGWVTFQESKVHGFGDIINKTVTIDSNDINLDNVTGFVTSYPGIQGMSGGPLFNHNTNNVIGLMSFGLPADNQVKTNLFAINMKDILEVIAQ